MAKVQSRIVSRKLARELKPSEIGQVAGGAFTGVATNVGGGDKEYILDKKY